MSEEPIQLQAPAAGTCVDKREEETQISRGPNVRTPNLRRQSQLWSALRSRILTWWLLLSHLIVSTAILVGILYFLEGYMAVDDAAGPIWEFRDQGYRLRVGDVTTIISAVLVTNKFLVSAWTALTIWRCSYILMEADQGLKISRLRRILYWRVPAERPVGRVGWMVTIVLLLLFPQPLIGPVITGAVGWSTAVEFAKDALEVHTQEREPESLVSWLIDDRGYSEEAADEYDWHLLVMDTLKVHDAQNETQPMSFVATRGGGLTSMLFDPEGNIDPDLRTNHYYKYPCRQRVAPHDHTLSVHSKTYNVTMPCILIEEITWTQVPVPLFNETFNAWSNATIFGVEHLGSQVAGVAILFDPQFPKLVDRWHNKTKAGFIQFPEPTIVRETLTLVVLLDWNSHACNFQKMENATRFGSFLKSGLTQSTIKVDKNRCYGYAKVKVTAGLVVFEEAEFVIKDVFEGKRDTALSPGDFLPDRWAQPALMMLPDVMLRVAISNTSRMATWDDLNGYIRTLITQSYMGAWGVLRNMESENPPIYVRLAETRLQAHIQRWRVLVWYMVNLLVPLSGIVWYFGAQKFSNRPMLDDPLVEALITDCSRKLVAGAQNLDNVVVDITDVSNASSRSRRVGWLRFNKDSGHLELLVNDAVEAINVG